MENTALLIAGILFLIVAVLHFLRFVLRIEVKIGRFLVPLWFSILGSIFPLVLAIYMFKSIR